jgi:hypothetical protein
MIGWNVVAAVAMRVVISSAVIVVSWCYVQCIVMDEVYLVLPLICVAAIAAMGWEFAMVMW